MLAANYLRLHFVRSGLPTGQNLWYSFSSRLHRTDRKGPYAPRLSAVSPGLPSKQCQCLVVHRSFSTLESGISATSFLHSSFLQVINSVKLWPVHVQKVPQASEHLCPTQLQIRCDICCACQSICPFILTESSVHRTVDTLVFVAKDCA